MPYENIGMFNLILLTLQIKDERLWISYGRLSCSARTSQVRPGVEIAAEGARRKVPAWTAGQPHLQELRTGDRLLLLWPAAGRGGGTADAQHTRPCSAWAARSPAPRGQPPKRSPSRRPRGHPAPSSWRVAWSCDRRPPPARERKGCGQAPRSLSGRHPSRPGARRHGAVRE